MYLIEIYFTDCSYKGIENTILHCPLLAKLLQTCQQTQHIHTILKWQECINVMRTQNKMNIDRLRFCIALFSNECKNMRVKDWILLIRQY